MANAIAPRRRQWRRLLAIPLILLAVLIVAIGICEFIGWPFLGKPLERKLSEGLERPVSLGTKNGGFTVRFFGALRAHSSLIEIPAPAWSKAPHMLLARDVDLGLRYGDLWRAYKGEPLRIDKLVANELDAYVERLADGRASWQWKPSAPKTDAKPTALPVLGDLRVNNGIVRYSDAPLDTQIEARMSLTEGEGKPQFKATATGHYKQNPVKASMVSAGVLPWVVQTEGGATRGVPLEMSASVGRASMSFQGTAADLIHLGGLAGQFTVSGPSLAAAGDPLGVTLPTTPPFKIKGSLSRKAQEWGVAIEDATIGTSSLNGQFTFDQAPAIPKLTGRLGGSRLMLVDLGPTIGTGPASAASAPAAAASAVAVVAGRAPAASSTKQAAATPRKTSTTTSSTAGNTAGTANKTPTQGAGRVLPDRPFDLPSLRAMNADVRIDIAVVDLNTSILQPLQPLRAHLVLDGGVLSLTELDARTADGQLGGDLRLDGREAQALWDAKLNWSGVRLERWLKQKREGEGPYWVTGQLSGRADLQGQGRSTAQILGSLKGGVRTELRNGTVSHLAVEAAGLDIAQALGVFVKGDDSLKVQCAVADLQASQGLLRPRVFVVDTPDSAMFIDGSLSLATEQMDLKVVVTPKDFSPLALRTPLHVRGTFADPALSLETGRLAQRLGAAVLLALINPIAAVIPLVDTGDAKAADKASNDCQSLAQRAKSQQPAARGGSTAAAARPTATR